MSWASAIPYIPMIKTSYVGNSSAQQKDDSITNTKASLILAEVYVFSDEKVNNVYIAVLLQFLDIYKFFEGQ